MTGLLSATLLLAPPTLPVPSHYLDTELHAGIFAEAGNERLLRALGILTRLGRRWGDLGGFVVADLSTWRSPLVGTGAERQTVVNLGVGLELLLVDGLVRSTNAIGTSILLQGTEADEPGTTGLFLDLRPLSYRWQVSDDWHINFAPIGSTIMLPVLTGIPLVELQFRTAISGEFAL